MGHPPRKKAHDRQEDEEDHDQNDNLDIGHLCVGCVQS